MLFQISSYVLPSTMLVVAIAPGFTSEFISGVPLLISTDTIELNFIPVASAPIVLRIASGPRCCITAPS